MTASRWAGHGASGDRPGTPTWDAYAHDVTALLRQLDLRDARLFGFSMGGGVALAVAAAHPDRVTRVAAHATNVQWTEAPVERMVPRMEQTLAEPDGRWARRLRAVHGDRWRTLVDDLVTFTRRLPDDWIEDDVLRTIRQPVLVSAGDADRYFDVRHALHLAQTIPDARLWIEPGLDHPVQGVDAPSFARRIQDHLLS